MITKHKISGIALGAALAFGAATTAAQATTVYATSVDSYTQGTNTMASGVIAADRLVTDHALGAADGKFLSLGLTGEVILSFGQAFTGPMKIVEVTFGTRASHEERVYVYAGLSGVFTWVGQIINSNPVNTLAFGGRFDQLKLVDASPVVDERDGFDIDAVGVSPIPLPAGGLLLLSALGAGAALRRRAKKTA